MMPYFVRRLALAQAPATARQAITVIHDELRYAPLVRQVWRCMAAPWAAKPESWSASPALH